MVLPDDEHCRLCHVAGNDIGAAAMVLPPKSVLCMPCHAATFSVGDTVTILTLIAFGLGMFGVLAYWFSGSVALATATGPLQKLFSVLGDTVQHLFSTRIFPFARAVFLDVLLQRRLFRLSKTRWLIHSLIFWPFVVRFAWGMVGLIGSLWYPRWGAVWTLLDKNAPVTAFLFDLTGLVLMLGIVLAWIRGASAKTSPLPGLPRRDTLALALIGGIVGVGFVLEGMRIAMTGSPPGSEFAFVGYALSRGLTDASWLTDAYGYVWYAHAVLTGVFIAYLPFGRLLHVITAPIVLAMNAAHEDQGAGGRLVEGQE
jgi:nitrate reductase gamma subunit